MVTLLQLQQKFPTLLIRPEILRRGAGLIPKMLEGKPKSRVYGRLGMQKWIGEHEFTLLVRHHA